MLFGIYEEARRFMAENGNGGQWGKTEPRESVIRKNVEDGDMYVLEEDGQIGCVFFFAVRPDPTYAVIEGGEWLAPGPYGVIHRIAAAGKRRGAAGKCIDWALARCGNLRIDTHENNLPMQSLLNKKGFTRCGIIYLANGSPRIAFQKCIKKEEKKMIRFECDYAEGAHPAILRALEETNLEQTPGYGLDPWCDRARATIRKLIGKDDAEVHFLVGGTQANFTVISAALRPWQGVVAAESAHIAVHETGAVEGTAHKVITLPAHDGKLCPKEVEQCFASHYASPTSEHEVQPGMVYISHPTETGTLYTKEELTALSRICRKYHAPLFLDGARLGYGLTAPSSDMTIRDIASLCDVFYIGGTKIGMLFGEAVVMTNPAYFPDFRYMIKHCGGMLAKGRLLGVQFETMLKDGLYFEVAKEANRLAFRLKEELPKLGIPLYVDSPTNQQFFVFPDGLLEALSDRCAFSFTAKVDPTHTAVRVCTSWATTEEQVDALLCDLRRALG